MSDQSTHAETQESEHAQGTALLTGLTSAFRGPGGKNQANITKEEIVRSNGPGPTADLFYQRALEQPGNRYTITTTHEANQQGGVPLRTPDGQVRTPRSRIKT